MGLEGRFPSIDAILDAAVVVTGQIAANAAFTARTELQAEIERIAAEQADAWHEQAAERDWAK